MPEYSFTREFAEEVARRFAAGDTIGEIADDTCNTPGDVEELLRVQIRAMTAALSQAQMMRGVLVRITDKGQDVVEGTVRDASVIFADGR